MTGEEMYRILIEIWAKEHGYTVNKLSFRKKEEVEPDERSN